MAGIGKNVSETLLYILIVAIANGSDKGLISSSNSENLWANIDWKILYNYLSFGKVKFKQKNLLYNL